jgi:hypothetical protein
VLAGEKVIGLETRGDQRVLKTESNRQIAVDGVVAGLGIEPRPYGLAEGLRGCLIP